MADRIQLISLVDRFLSFYEETRQVTSLESQYAIWQDKYGFAAVPPGKEGEAIAFSFFQKAYPDYAAALPHLTSFVPNLELVQEILAQVKALLGYEGDMEFSVLYFVGFFENNAFVTSTADGSLALCLPVETQNSVTDHRITLAHELTHLVHAQILGEGANWNRPLSSLILQEGLAMKVSQALVEISEPHTYLTQDKGWYQECLPLKQEIVEGLAPYIADRESETLLRFTMGEGTTQHQREAYIVAWFLFETLLARGWSLADLARISTSQSVPFVTEYLPFLGRGQSARVESLQ